MSNQPAETTNSRNRASILVIEDDPAIAESLGDGLSQPYGVAVDAGGNVFVADFGNNEVKKIPSGCATSSCVITIGGGFSHPYSVAVDGAGNVLVSDHGNDLVKLIPSGCTTIVSSELF